MKILLVEDVPAQKRLLAKVISKEKNNLVVTADDALEAYVLLKAHGDIDLVVADFYMPYLNGCDFLQKLRSTKQFLETPVIIVSANLEESIKERALSFGPSAFLNKPFTMEKLNEILKDLGDQNG